MEQGKEGEPTPGFLESFDRIAAETTAEINKTTRDLLGEYYGSSLGEALFNYNHVEPSSSEDESQRRKALVEAIVLALESRSHKDRVKGIEALLEAIEGKIGPVAQKAERAYLWTKPLR